MPNDPTRHSENDSAPFARTSEAAAARRQSPPFDAHDHDKEIEPPVQPGDDVHSEKIAAVNNVSRANLMTPTRQREPHEKNPELERKGADAGKR
ncbi:MAG: hypothetical protein EOO28_28605 [Comamonadaceae bacterium]|nr:MAG: hypothetical protein EOO28_28605 [Comamonadaceae bacterium]